MSFDATCLYSAALFLLCSGHVRRKHVKTAGIQTAAAAGNYQPIDHFPCRKLHSHVQTENYRHSIQIELISSSKKEQTVRSAFRLVMIHHQLNQSRLIVLLFFLIN